MMSAGAVGSSEVFEASAVVGILRGIEERLATAWVEGNRAYIEEVN